MKPATLPAELADLAKVPVRLLAHLRTMAAVDRATQRQSELQMRRDGGNTSADEESPDVGGMDGAQDPEAMVDEQAGKAIALDAELKRWKRVALKELRSGRNPGQRAFESKAIPQHRHTGIVEALQVATNEQEVKAAFEAAPFWSNPAWEDYP